MENSCKNIGGGGHPELVYITYFRAVAIIFILLGHTLWGRDTIYHSNIVLFEGGTIFFVFIAGYLFQYLSYKFDYKEYLKKKFFNVFLPNIVTLFPFAIIFAKTLTYTDNPLYYLTEPMRFISSFPCGAFVNGVSWFIWMITMLFLLAPVLLKLEKHKKVWYTLLLASLIFSIFVNRPSGNILKYIDSSSGALKIWLVTFYQIYFKSLLHFFSAYIGGMTLCTFVQKYPDFIFKYKKQILAVLFSVFIISYIVCVFFYFRRNRIFFIKMDMMLIIFCLLYIYEKAISSKVWLDKCLKFLAKYSFGIFFLHIYFIKYALFRTLSYAQPPIVWYCWKNTIRAFLYASAAFWFALLGSLLVLWVIKTILNKFGIKNTRMFIGV